MKTQLFVNGVEVLDLEERVKPLSKSPSVMTQTQAQLQQALALLLQKAAGDAIDPIQARKLAGDLASSPATALVHENPAAETRP